MNAQVPSLSLLCCALAVGEQTRQALGKWGCLGGGICSQLGRGVQGTLEPKGRPPVPCSISVVPPIQPPAVSRSEGLWNLRRLGTGRDPRLRHQGRWARLLLGSWPQRGPSVPVQGEWGGGLPGMFWVMCFSPHLLGTFGEGTRVEDKHSVKMASNQT